MASGLPCAIKATYPDAKVYWLCQPECRALLANHPQVDEVITWPRGEWQKLWSAKKYPALYQAYRELAAKLRSYNFDLAMDLQGLLKSALLTRASGAKQLVGLGSSEGGQWLMNRVLPRDQGDIDMIGSEYRYLAQQMGFDIEQFRMRIGVSEQADHNAKQILENLDAAGEYIVFCPFTTRPQKHWFNKHWRQLAERIESELKCPVLVLGGPGDLKAASDLCASTNLINLAGKTGLQEAAALIEKSAGLVGVDTGLTHIGHAKQVPTVALFGSTVPYRKTPSARSKVIYLQRHCAPCRRNPTCGGSFDCLKNITADMAYDALIEMRGRIG